MCERIDWGASAKGQTGLTRRGALRASAAGAITLMVGHSLAGRTASAAESHIHAT